MPEIDLSKFYVADPQSDMGKPWIDGGWKYACNGFICVRVRTDESDSSPENRQFATIPEIFARHPDSPLAPWPTDAPFRGIEKCEMCEGSRLIGGTKCEPCEGVGETTCETCNHTHECEFCRGNGKVNRKRCPICKGHDQDEYFEHAIYRVIGDKRIAMKFDRLIAELSNVQYRVESSIGPAGHPLIFIFDGGEGAVMSRTAYVPPTDEAKGCRVGLT